MVFKWDIQRDRCWDSNPFHVTDETKKMVMDNICYLLNNFIKCSAYKNIIFYWEMHEQSIIDTIIERTNVAECDIKVISLTASEMFLTEKIISDVKSGVQTVDVPDRSIARISLYRKLNSIKIDTDGKSIEKIANEIMML